MVERRLKASRDQEKRLAAHFGGKRTPGSGNQWHTKNDVRTESLSIEAKTTAKGQYTLKARELEMGERNALLDNREFLFVIEMNGREWVVQAIEDYHLLLQDVYESAAEVTRLERELNDLRIEEAKHEN